MDSLKPSIRYVLGLMAPTRASARWALNHFEEVYAGALTLMEWRYLSKHSASFGEHFYGLLRASPGAKGKPIDQSGALRSLVYLVGLPYVKSKLDAMYMERYGSAATLAPAQVPGSNPERTLVQRFFKKWYPYIHATYELSSVAYMIAYLHRRTRFYSPSLHLQNLVIRRVSMAERREAAERLSQSAQGSNSLLGSLYSFMDGFWAVALPTTLFAFKFAEWWYAERRLPIAKTPIPPPPPPPAIIRPLPDDPLLCPLCLKARTQPTLSETGFVFCFGCIHDALVAHPICPISGRPCRIDRLRRIYEAVSG